MAEETLPFTYPGVVVRNVRTGKQLPGQVGVEEPKHLRSIERILRQAGAAVPPGPHLSGSESPQDRQAVRWFPLLGELSEEPTTLRHLVAAESQLHQHLRRCELRQLPL